MDLNYIALWLAALPALSLFWRSIRAPHRPRGWIFVSATVLTVAGIGWFCFRDLAGYLSGALAVLFMMLPSWAHNTASRALKAFDYPRARRFSILAAALHPLDGWPSLPRLFLAFELAHAGKTAEAEALLQLLARGYSDTAAVARAQRLRLLGRWRELEVLGEQAGLEGLSRNPNLLLLYLRALGERGRSADLAEFMMAREGLLTATGTLEPALLYLFAFTGQVALTRQALSGQNEGYGLDTREAWIAMASKCAGDADSARRDFDRLRRSDDAQVRERAQHYFDELTHATPNAPPSLRTMAVVQHFARALAERRNLILSPPGQRVQRRVTLLLVVLNAAIYVLGSYPSFLDTREDFGNAWAFVGEWILRGDWWRVFSYMFVHANAIHLLMNLAGLWALGPFVERAFGQLRFCVIYLAAGLTGSVVYLGISWFQLREDAALVGASGCIMGLLGATAAVMLRAWIKQRAAMARQIFLRLLVVVALQVAFDYSTPMVAGLAHALGLFGGFVAGLLLRENVSPRRSVSALS